MLRTAKPHRPAVCRVLGRGAAAVAAASIAVLVTAAPALAHITVTPNSAPAGSAAVLTFHVPNEEAKAETVKVDMQIPTAHPIVDLLVKPVPGWNASVKDITLAKPVTTDDGRFTQAVSEVTWSGGKIAPGQFEDFSVSADPLPTGVSSVAFKAIQTYSNGDVVSWIDLPVAGQPEPDHPAPVLTLTKASASGAQTVSKHGGTAAAPSASASDGTARMLGVTAVVVAVLALATAAAGLLRRRASGG